MDSAFNFCLESLHIPAGYRFNPTDEQVVKHFLLARVLGRSLTPNMIQDLEIFRYDPEQLPLGITKISGDWGYFFVYRKLGDEEGGGDCVRTTPGGYWKAKGTGRYIMDREKREAIGFMRKMVFYRGKAPDGEKTDWKLREYRLNPALSLLKNPHDTEKLNEVKTFYVLLDNHNIRIRKRKIAGSIKAKIKSNKNSKICASSKQQKLACDMIIKYI